MADVDVGSVHGLLAGGAIGSRVRFQWSSPRVVRDLVQMSEMCLLLLAGFGTAWMLEGLTYLQNIHILILVTFMSAAIPIVFRIFELYRFIAMRGHVITAIRLASIYTGMIVAGVLILQLLGTLLHFSSRWMIAWFGVGFVFLGCWRLLIGLTLRSWSKAANLERRIAVIGVNERSESFLEALLESKDEVKVVGFFDDRGRERTDTHVADVPVLGSCKDLLRICLEGGIDSIIVCLPMKAEDRIINLVSPFADLPLHIRLSTHGSKLPLSKTNSSIGRVKLLDILDRPISEWNYLAKATLDFTGALLGLILLSPLCAVVCVLIKLDSAGPVFFTQRRRGFNNCIIKIYKFRSLYHEMRDDSASKLVSGHDPRVTRVGRFIRKTSIDEIPQLLNVLKGELSLVGPRPHALGVKAEDKHYDDLVANYYARHRVKPGVTGWAQVNGWRGETDKVEKLERRVEHDLNYIENWSLWLDLRILIATPLSLIKHRDAAN